jgi:para-nitrobenzyl esterase
MRNTNHVSRARARPCAAIVASYIQGLCTSRFAVGFVFGFAALFAAMSWGMPGAQAAGRPAIVTESGPLKGVVTPQLEEYLGIPYAAAPVGTLRWMPPQAFGRWQGVFGATQFGNDCVQPGDGDEDCLFLNIYTPRMKKNADKHDRLAVMVWIHGGGLVNGAGRDFDPTPLIEGGGVIVVTFNYRLGLLGFLAHPALDSESHLVGNYGFMDQQFALAWVQRNIAAFGGDPDRVTIFGESAGGLSVYSQLASPLAAGLFQQAIAQSGAYAGFGDYLDRMRPIAAAETVSTPGVESGVAVANAVGCVSQTAACLRAIPPAMFIGLSRAIFPFIDGTLLPQAPGTAFASGSFNRVPVMTGTNHDEYRYFVAQNYDLDKNVGPLMNSDYPSAIGTLFWSLTTANLAAVLADYPPPPSLPADAGSLELGAAGTDGTFACAARRAMQALAQYVTVHAYEFNDENAPGFSVSFPLGAYHGADVQYLFNRNGKPAPFTLAQQQLSQAMISYWTQFAKTGDPNSPGQPAWAPYDPATDERQSFVPPVPVVESGFAGDHDCDLWDSF